MREKGTSFLDASIVFKHMLAALSQFSKLMAYAIDMEAEEEDWFQPSYEWTSRTTDMDSGVVTLTATAHDGTTLEMQMLQDMGMFSLS